MYSVVAIPLNRPDVHRFLLPHSQDGANGSRAARDDESVPATVEIIDQRPTTGALRTWARKLDATPRADQAALLDHFLAIDAPHSHLTTVPTTHLVPTQFLREPGFLSRNLGGWVPVYFAVLGTDADPKDAFANDAADPMLRQAQVLTTYGDTIRHFGADREMVRRRFAEEMDADPAVVAEGVVRLEALDQEEGGDPMPQVPRLVAAIDGSEPLRTAAGALVPEPLLCDALMDRMVRAEQTRRAADMRGDADALKAIAVRQREWAEDLNVQLILKGEYIAGRHRRSTICIAPSLGVVVKQPGPEPFHDIKLGATTHNGEPENWPFLTKDGAVVTSRGRVRIVLEEDVVPPLHAAFDHGVDFSSALGLIIEDHVPGTTLQAFISEDPRRLTADIYREILVTQQVCEALDVNNPDWHSANFIVEAGTRDLVHIDWGAARPLEEHEHTPEVRKQRVEQVRNFAYSFQNDALAERTDALHEEITGDPEQMMSIRRTAQALVDNLRT
jgi:hypothetical protein